MENIKKFIQEDLQDYNTEDEKRTYLEDVVNYGGVSGAINRLIRYSDTNKFYDRYEDEIEELLREFAEEIGAKNRMDAISQLNGSENVGNITQEKNLLAWFAYEEVARQMLDEM